MIYFTLGFDSSLNCHNICQVFHDTFPPSKARELGVQLELPILKIDEFSYNNQRDCLKMMQDVIGYWLENDKDKSWMKLAGAVEACDQAALADNIRSNLHSWQIEVTI